MGGLIAEMKFDNVVLSRCVTPSPATEAPAHHLAAPARICKATCAKRNENFPAAMDPRERGFVLSLAISTCGQRTVKEVVRPALFSPHSAFRHLCFCGAIVHTTEDYMLYKLTGGSYATSECSQDSNHRIRL
jgi:hypothetical protein